MALDLQHHITGPGAITLQVGGRVDITAVASLRSALRSVMRNPVTFVVVDLSGVEQLDVAAVTAIASSAATVRRVGAAFQIVQPDDPNARRALDHCGLIELLGA